MLEAMWEGGMGDRVRGNVRCSVKGGGEGEVEGRVGGGMIG